MKNIQKSSFPILQITSMSLKISKTKLLKQTKRCKIMNYENGERQSQQASETNSKTNAKTINLIH